MTGEEWVAAAGREPSREEASQLWAFWQIPFSDWTASGYRYELPGDLWGLVRQSLACVHGTYAGARFRTPEAACAALAAAFDALPAVQRTELEAAAPAALVSSTARRAAGG